MILRTYTDIQQQQEQEEEEQQQQRTKPAHTLSNKNFWICAAAASAREKAATRSLQKREGRPRKPTGFRGFRGRPSARARARARAKC